MDYNMNYEKWRAAVAIIEYGKPFLDDNDKERLNLLTQMYTDDSHVSLLEDPRDAGFIKIKELFKFSKTKKTRREEISRQLASFKSQDRGELFLAFFRLARRASKKFKIYIGRAEAKWGTDPSGTVDRWKDHYGCRKEKSRWGRVVAVVHEDQIKEDETLLIRTSKLWAILDVLICEPDGMICLNERATGQGNIDENNEWHALYLCLTPK